MKLLDFEVGIDQSFFLISGLCVIESEKLVIETATYLKQVTDELGVNFIYKSSCDKAHRTSTGSFRGLSYPLSALFSCYFGVSSKILRFIEGEIFKKKSPKITLLVQVYF